MEKALNFQLPKVTSKVEGLDTILEGGFALNRTTIVMGGPGCGKTIVGMEFLYRNALAGKPGIFISFEESVEDLLLNMKTLDFDIEKLIKQNKLAIIDARFKSDIVVSGEFDISGLLAIIKAKAKQMNAELIVIDAIDVLLQVFDSTVKERTEVNKLHDWLKNINLTSIITVKSVQEKNKIARYEFLDYMADSVIRLDQRMENQISTRRLRVLKYRGSSFGRNEYPYLITPNGLYIIPVTNVNFGDMLVSEKFSSGHLELDLMLGDGYLRNSSILISGNSGTGKTTLAAIYSKAAVERKEKVLSINLEQSQNSLISTMLSPGIDLRPALKNGMIQFITNIPEAFGVEEHLYAAMKTIKEFKPEHVIIDAISACDRMGGEQAGMEYAIRLITYVKSTGATCVILNQSNNANSNEYELSGYKISSLIDTVVLLRLVEIGGEFNRTLSVIKSRGTKNSNQLREFLITDNGVKLMDVYVGTGGVLTGTARQEAIELEQIEKRKIDLSIALKKLEINKKEKIIASEVERLKAELDLSKGELETLVINEGLRQDGRDDRSVLRQSDNKEEGGKTNE